MKKWIVLAVTLIIVASFVIVLLLPRSIRVSVAVRLETPSGALMRYEFEQGNWQRWWPGSNSPANALPGASFHFNNRSYTVSDKKLGGYLVNISSGGDSIASTLNFNPVNAITAVVTWETRVSSSGNPISRLRNWSQAGELRSDLSKILDSLVRFYTDDSKIYGMEIKPNDLVDTLLISNYAEQDHYPSTTEIYSLIDAMRVHGRGSGLSETGQPMLNISPSSSGVYLVRVAIPVNKRVAPSGNISYKQMPLKVRMITADITGGQKTADQAMLRMGDYATDHGLKPPAIPYFSLLTDRRAEPDTSKWITRIYFPVM